MIGFLKYRFPNQSVEEKRGGFVPTNKFSENSFVLSDFTQKRTFVFQENTDVEVQNPTKPTIYSKAEYLKLASDFKAKMIASNCSKAIFSRIKEVEMSISSEELFNRLCKNYPNALVYHFSSPNLGEWIGATPEILLTSEKKQFQTVALAGTKLASDNTPWQQKEIEEQAFVSEFIRDGLHQLEATNVRENGPKDKIAGPVKHLLTEFSFESVRSKDVILKTLHPTPAVSGVPQSKAIELIHSTEQHSREFYTGFLGRYGDNSSIYVNLRCAQIIDNQLYLYLGGGFTKDSDIEAEFQETENKASTFLNLIS